MGNINILDGMSDEQLEKDRHEILKTLDPSLIKFLTDRGTKQGSHAEPKTNERLDAEMKEEDSCIPTASETEDTSFVPVKLPKGLEMLKKCRIEREKMEWMRDLDEDDMGDQKVWSLIQFFKTLSFTRDYKQKCPKRMTPYMYSGLLAQNLMSLQVM